MREIKWRVKVPWISLTSLFILSRQHPEFPSGSHKKIILLHPVQKITRFLFTISTYSMEPSLDISYASVRGFLMFLIPSNGIDEIAFENMQAALQKLPDSLQKLFKLP